MEQHRHQVSWNLCYGRLVMVSLPTGWQQCVDHTKTARYSGRRRRKELDMQLVACIPTLTGLEFVSINQSSGM